MYYGSRVKYPTNPDGTCTSQQTLGSGPLPFFETRAAGSEWATEYCACGVHQRIHDVSPARGRDHVFVERGPSEFDAYYCGCFGWD